MPTSHTLHGLVAEFETAADVLHAAIRVRDAGYRRWDVHTPFPIHGMDDAMGLSSSPVGWFTFFGGAAGFTTGMTMIWWMNKWDYPIVVGGKPLFSPLFAFPVSYEMTILLAAFGTVFGMLFLNRLPKLYSPLLKKKSFARASHDRFYVVVEASDPRFSETETRKLLESAGSKHIELVEE
jgi:Protein of unknown function (DUF3341)